MILYQIHTLASISVLYTIIRVNSSPTSAACMRHWIVLALDQMMACRLFGTKLLPEPMLAYCQLDSWEQMSVKFEYEFYHFHSRKYIWNCSQPKWRPLCPRGRSVNGGVILVCCYRVLLRLWSFLFPVFAHISKNAGNSPWEWYDIINLLTPVFNDIHIQLSLRNVFYEYTFSVTLPCHSPTRYAFCLWSIPGNVWYQYCLSPDMQHRQLPLSNKHGVWLRFLSKPWVLNTLRPRRNGSFAGGI